ncbi:oxidoreductase [Furfurilactobacillus entadae]|uniref:oxidoreductase n=1 Tax=Furfurilactobacillus entadae TaxID=2922307 RepID=UPI0035EF2024
MQPKPVALITGASSGMGAAAAKQFLHAGYTVYAGARHVDKMADLAALGIHTCHLDVTDGASNQAFVDQVLAETGRIDVLINNAGYGSFGALEDVSSVEAKRQFDVNVFGAMNLTQLVLPTMRQQHYGKIINNSSIGGQIYGTLGGWYFASKHALEALSDTLRLEVADFGIDVIIIEPGGTNTNWGAIAADNLLKVTPLDSPYRTAAESFGMLSGAGFSRSPEDLDYLMWKTTTIAHPKSRYQASFGDKLAVVAARKLSYRMYDRLAKFATKATARHNAAKTATEGHLTNN